MFLVFGAGIVSGLSATFKPLLTGLIDPFAVLAYTILHVAIVGVVSHGYRRALVPCKWTNSL
jgi:hypothetical protein